VSALHLIRPRAKLRYCSGRFGGVQTQKEAKKWLEKQFNKVLVPDHWVDAWTSLDVVLQVPAKPCAACIPTSAMPTSVPQPKSPRMVDLFFQRLRHPQHLNSGWLVTRSSLGGRSEIRRTAQPSHRATSDEVGRNACPACPVCPPVIWELVGLCLLTVICSDGWLPTSAESQVLDPRPRRLSIWKLYAYVFRHLGRLLHPLFSF
jgi:hypothetical protein